MITHASNITRKDIALLIGLILVAFGIRLYFLTFYEVISADGVSYVSIARDFITGKGLSAATHYPPFYPMLLGLASTLLGDFETAGLAVSIVMGSLVVIPVYLLGAEFYDRRTGLIAAVLTTTWPALRYWSTAVMSQATYITLLLFGIYVLWQAYKRDSIFLSILAAIFFAGANLTRSEGVLVLFAESTVLILFTFINRLPLRKLLYVLGTLCVFFIAISPYLLMLHELTGKWQLTGKSKIAIADALSEYLGKPDIKHDPSFKELGYLDLVRQYPDYIRTNYLKNIKACWHEMLPFYGWMLAIIGFLAGGLSRGKIFERAYLLATFAPLSVIIVFFFIGPEYTQPYLPVLFLWIGNGLRATEKLVVRGLRISMESPAVRYGWCVPLFVVVLYATWNAVSQVPADRDKPYEYTKDGGRYDDKRIGLKLRKTLPDGAVIMTRSGRIGFYSERRWVLPPEADYAAIIEYAKKEKVSYLIATIQLFNMRPQLQFLYAPLTHPERSFNPPPELELIVIGQEPGGLPYLVYRLI